MEQRLDRAYSSFSKIVDHRWELKQQSLAGSGTHLNCCHALIGETGGATFFKMESALGRASAFRLRRFSTVDRARDVTTASVRVEFTVTCMTFFLSDPQCELRRKFRSY